MLSRGRRLRPRRALTTQESDEELLSPPSQLDPELEPELEPESVLSPLQLSLLLDESEESPAQLSLSLSLEDPEESPSQAVLSSLS